MPFKDLPEGQTHSFNDGCGEPAHNPMEEKKQENKCCEKWLVHNKQFIKGLCACPCHQDPKECNIYCTGGDHSYEFRNELSTDPKVESWEEDLADIIFKWADEKYNPDVFKPISTAKNYKAIESFISQKLSAAREEGYNEALEYAVKIAEGMKKPSEVYSTITTHGDPEVIGYVNVDYNSALSALITKLREELK